LPKREDSQRIIFYPYNLLKAGSFFRGTGPYARRLENSSYVLGQKPSKSRRKSKSINTIAPTSNISDLSLKFISLKPLNLL
jgi:hypothetical protein